MKVTIAAEGRQRELEIELIDREESVFRLTLAGNSPCDIQVLARRASLLTLDIDGTIRDFVVFQEGGKWIVEPSDGLSTVLQIIDKKRLGGAGEKVVSVEGVVSLKAQMPGKVIRVLKGPGETVEAGQGLVIIESMKMQNELKSPKSGSVRSCGVREGENIHSGQLLFEVE